MLNKQKKDIAIFFVNIYLFLYKQLRLEIFARIFDKRMGCFSHIQLRHDIDLFHFLAG